MHVRTFDLPGLIQLTPRQFPDARGMFVESYNAAAAAAAGVTAAFVQDNLSRSTHAGTVRGLHYQSPPHAQAKLVSVLKGRVRDVAVDVRRGSPTYGRHVAVDLDAEGGAQLYVPVGFLHGFITLTDDVLFAYKVSDRYAADCEGSVAWNDPNLAIDWGLDPAKAILSPKDAEAPAFRDFDSPFVYDGAGEDAA